MSKSLIPVYAVNLERRIDRRSHIIQEFSGKLEFDLHIIKAFEEPIGAVGLWKTIREIVKERIIADEDYFVLCEDDHAFTSDYSFEALQNAINDAQQRNADILLGGVSCFHSALVIHEKLFCIEKFTGLQFAIVFKKFYQKILDY